MTDETMVMSGPIGEGSAVEGFHLGRLLGRGAQGSVHLANKDGTNERYAAKVIDTTGMAQQALDRIRRECTITSRMRHPGIIAVHRVITQAPYLIIVMDLAVGKPGDQLCDGRLGWEMAVKVVRAAASALSYAHQHNGVIHRDIKPANLMVDLYGGALRGVKVVDFGLSRSARANDIAPLTMTGAIMGTPNYMSPEQAQGEKRIDFTTDVYALGASLFHFIAGRPPFNKGSPVEILVHHCKSTPPLLSALVPQCPRAVSDLVDRCLRKNPSDRFRSYRDFLVAIDAVLDTNPFDLANDTATMAPTPGTDQYNKAGSTTAVGAQALSSLFRNKLSQDATPTKTTGTAPVGGSTTTRWRGPTNKDGSPAAPTSRRYMNPALKPVTLPKIIGGEAPPAPEPEPEDDTDLDEAEFTLGPAPDTRPAEPSLKAGEIIENDFVVIGPLGAGAMGEVYEVEDIFIRRRLAMKIISEADMQRPGAVRRFHAECSALATLTHEAFPFFAGRGTHDSRAYLFMELAQGVDLKKWLKRKGGTLNERDALSVVRQLAKGLETSYRVCGMVHRDLKPANLMITVAEDGSPLVRIIDFGVSIYIDYGDWDDYTDRTYTYIDDGNEGRTVGTPAYMSPEQVLGGPPSPLMDIYSIGVIFFQLITGKLPFSSQNSAGMMMKHLHETPPNFDDLGHVSIGSKYMIKRFLAKKPEQRFKNYAQIITAVDSALSGSALRDE